MEEIIKMGREKGKNFWTDNFLSDLVKGKMDSFDVGMNRWGRDYFLAKYLTLDSELLKIENFLGNKSFAENRIVQQKKGNFHFI